MRQQELMQMAKKRFQEISHHLEDRLNELYEQGAITDLDYKKMRSDGVQSGLAVLHAIQNTEYPPEMQQELVENLIMQFEESTAKILKDAETRLLEPNALKKKMSDIDQRIAAEFGVDAQRWLNSNPVEINKLHKDFLKSIRSTKRKSNQLSIEQVYKVYEQSSRQLFLQLTPRIGMNNSSPKKTNAAKEAETLKESHSLKHNFINKIFGRRRNK